MAMVMTNYIYTKLEGKNVGLIFNKYFKTNKILVEKIIKDDFVQILTEQITPYEIIAKISTEIGKVDIIHFWCENDSFGNNKYENIWNNGKMIKSYIYTFDYKKGKYNNKIEIKTIDKFGITLKQI